MIWYGDWKDGSVIKKDSKGYYIDQWSNTKGTYRKYLKGFKPKHKFSVTPPGRKIKVTVL